MDTFVCRKCNTEKNTTEYHKCKSTRGHRTACKSCVIENTKKWQFEHRDILKSTEQKRERDRRYKRDQYQRQMIAKHKEAKENLKKKVSDPKKINARHKLHYMIISGKIIRPSHCQVCGCENNRLHGHHHDYDKPHDVIFVCCSCHAWIHKKSEVNTFERVYQRIPNHIKESLEQDIA